MRRVAVTLAHVIFLIVLFPNNLLAVYETRLALIIGNSNYTHGGPLVNPINDVRAMQKALEGLGFSVMKYENCTQKQMKEAIDTFGVKLKSQDVGLFFYAGHGVQVKGHNYLIPIDAKLDNENDAEYDCVRADRVLAKMERAGTTTNIVILDACRDNPFERSWRRGTEGTGLAFMNAPSGSLIAYSTAPGKTALDGEGPSSPYTEALLQHIETPNITIIQMFQRVRSTVMQNSSGRQIPWESTSLSGDFYLKHSAEVDENGQIKGLTTTMKDKKSGRIIDLFEGLPGYNKEEEEKKTRIKKVSARKEIERRSKEIELNPNNVNAYLGRGIVYALDEDKWAKANDDFSKAIALNPKNAQAYLYRGLTFKAQKQYMKSIQDFTKAIELSQHVTTSPENKPMEEYIRSIRDYAELTPILIKLSPNIKMLYLLRAEAYFRLKQHKKAIQDYTKAIELSPKDTSLYEDRASAYSNLGQYDKAVQDCTRMIELEPKRVWFYLRRGLFHEKLEEHKKAIQDYTKAIELNPKDFMAYESRAYAFLKLKQHSKAIQDFTTIIELFPKNSNGYLGRGYAYLDVNQEIKAIKDFDKAIEFNPKNESAYYNRGLCYAHLKKDIKAIQDFDKAIELYLDRRKSIEADFKGDIKELHDLYKVLGFGDSRLSSRYHLRGTCYSILNQHTKAIQDFDRAIELDEESADAYVMRGISYISLNKTAKGCADLETACRLGNCEGLKDYVKLGYCH